MARGKYAARAANRLAQLDSELVNELREKLHATTMERDTARREADELRRQTASEAARIGRAAAAESIAQIQAVLDQERNDREKHKELYLAVVVQIIKSEGLDLTSNSWFELASLFGKSNSYLRDLLELTDSGREARRQRDRGLRLTDKRSEKALGLIANGRRPS